MTTDAKIPQGSGTVAPDPNCPLCRMWSAYARDGRGVAMAPAFKEHSFLVAGYWLGLKGDELGPLCKAHTSSLEAVELANAGTEPAPVMSPPTGDAS
jgi:hypothetical protein